jgi:GrpB-like predicted nucleotidyltransferase (UPF0157 family)
MKPSLATIAPMEKPLDEKEALERVEIADYDPAWPALFEAERDALLQLRGLQSAAFEHIGSTAVLGLRSKPIIDMMAAVTTLGHAAEISETLNKAGYKFVQTGMTNRIFMRKRASTGGLIFHLHIVERSSWDERQERMMRDYLLKNPEKAREYGELKDRIALEFAGDSLAYTKAKTEFIQEVINRARAERGLPAVDVWND